MCTFCRRNTEQNCIAHIQNLVRIKTLLIICCCTAFFILILSSDRPNLATNEDLFQEVIENVGQDPRYAELYRKKEKLSKNLKYILLWTPPDYAPFYYYESGQKAFIRNNCSFINCYVTSDREFLDNVTKFHAIAFNGRNLKSDRGFLPQFRSPEQKYIYFNMESADNFPVCEEIFDGLFNWTSTYKLNSDLPIPYIAIKNMQNELVGPKEEMHWERFEDSMIDAELDVRWKNKSKAAAWFVSACNSRSNRMETAKALRKAMSFYDMKLYIFGFCGDHQCPRSKGAECDKMLEKHYYFYLSFENSFSEDYVTEKLLTALKHDTVPIVLGGANYSRFLPPGSYLNALNQTPEDLAAAMHKIIHSTKLYQNYFKWKNFYTYQHASTESSENVCNLCAALNNDSIMKTRQVYNGFRKWWNPDFEERCKSGTTALVTWNQQLLYITLLLIVIIYF